MTIEALMWPLALLAASGMALHAALRWMSLAHGRMLSQDKALEHERKLDLLFTKSKSRDEQMVELIQRLEQQKDSIERAWHRIHEVPGMHKSLVERFDAVEQASKGFGESLANFVNETRPQIEALKQKEAMALAGITGQQKKALRIGP